MSHQATRLKREAVAPCMTCPLCHKLFRDATTIIECLHTFCRKCIHWKLGDEETDCCPTCKIYLGCAPLEKLRPDHNLQDLRTKTFPSKRIKVRALEVVTPIILPAKRKERSLSSLVVNTPRVPTKNGMTGRRSKSIAKKTSKGSSFTIEKPVMKEEYSIQGHHISSSDPGTSNRYTHKIRKKSALHEPSYRHSHDKGREKCSETSEGKVDLWKPLNYLVEVANKSKSSKFSSQGSFVKSEVGHAQNDEGLPKKAKRRAKIFKDQNENNGNEYIHPESEKHQKFCRVRPKKAHNSGGFKVMSQTVLDGASSKSVLRNYPIWFSLVASDEQEGDLLPLPQISASYIRIKDGSMPVSFIRKYIKAKLDLTSENEVDITCMGQAVIPTLTLNNLVDLWLQTTTEKVSAAIGSSAKEFVMALGYARRVHS